MTTELLRRGDNLTGAVSQADGATGPIGVSCGNGCGAPMQSIDTVAFAYRCSACGDIAVDPQRFGPIEDVATSNVNRALFELVNLQMALKRVTLAVTAVGHPLGAINIADVLPAVTNIIGLLRDESVDVFADAVHATAIAASARVCALRAASQYQDTKNPVAGLEASKCAFAIQRLRRRASLAERRELFADDPLAPEAAHA